LNCAVGECQLLEAMLFDLLRNQERAGDAQFLQLGVAVELDDLHPVA